MVVLIAILTPSLMAAHETARRIRCAAHIQQLGYGIHMYSDDRSGRLPPIEYRGATVSFRPPVHQNAAPLPAWSNDSMMARFEALRPGERYTPGGAAFTWDGLGILFAQQYIGHPAAFYCPSHHGRHHFSVYQHRWSTEPGAIICNYQYRVPPASPYLSDLQPWVTILADGMATKPDYNHRVGNNYLRTDASVGWYSDETGELYESLPDDPDLTPPTPGNGPNWRYLDQPVRD